MNLLHPLTSFQWRECFTDNGNVVWQGAHCVLLNSKVYVGNITTLHECSADLSSWKQLPVPVYQYALTTYQDRLVLVGGASKGSVIWPLRESIMRSSTNHSDKLWASIDGQTWDCSLHTPLPTRRALVAAFNTGTPEYLVVVGGLETQQHRIIKKVDKVEVLIGEQWVSLSPLPCTAHMLRPLVHNGNVIFSSETCPSFYCKLAELKAECELAYKDKYATPTSLIVWDELLSEFDGYCFLSYKHQLLHFTHRNGGKYVEKRAYVIKIHSPTINDCHVWSRIADLPAGWCPRAALVGPTGEIVMVVEDLSSSPVTSRILTGSVGGKEGREVVAHHCILRKKRTSCKGLGMVYQSCACITAQKNLTFSSIPIPVPVPLSVSVPGSIGTLRVMLFTNNFV